MAELKMKMGKVKSSPSKHRGTIHIDSTDIPEAKNWSIGHKVILEVEIEVTGLRKADKWEIEEEGKSKDAIDVQSDILKIKAPNASK